MLNSIRAALSGPLKWVFIALICAAFGVVGVPALENFGRTAAVSVSGQDISALEIEREITNRVQQIQFENPDATREQMMAQGLGEQVVETLIVRSLISAEAERLGLAAPNDVVRDYVEQIPGLQNPETGEFDNQRLGLLLQQRRISVSAFGDLVADELIRTQIVEALTSVGKTSDDLTRYLLLRQFEERDVAYASLPLTAGAEEPTEEEVTAYYDENIERFQSPEYRSFTVLTIQPEDVADEVTVSEEDVRQLFDARAGAAADEETRTVRQFRAAGDAAGQVGTLVAEGATFAAAAEAIGAEVTTLTDQQRADFIAEEFGEAVFAAEEGALVGPVETPFGSLVGEVVSINRVEGPVFEDQRAELEDELRAEISRDRLVELVDAFEIARDEGATIAEAADQIGLSARVTQPADAELFTQIGSIANIPAVLAQEGRSLALGEESAAVRVGDGYGFVSVEDIIPPAPLSIAEVRSDIVAAIEGERKADAATALEERLDALLDEGKTFAQAVTELGGEVQNVVVNLTSEERPIPDRAFAAAFDLKVGEHQLIPIARQDTADVVRLENVRFGDTSQVEQIVPLVSQQFADQLAGELNNAYLAALRETSEIKQNPRQLARGLGQTQQ
ncbi:MAG: SurA N-terminal domain-containing protein [Pseudomonadota bacterium]